MASIKNIIFDLGGVLLDIDYNKTLAAFQALGFADFDKMYSQYSADDVFERLETGDITNDFFYKTMEQRSGAHLSEDDIRLAWNAMLLNFRNHSLNFLQTLDSRYKLYLLSNTNAIHLAAFEKIFSTQTGNTSLNNYFTKAYYSHEVGLRKPNEDIFDFVLLDAGIDASESLFIDDSYNNIDTAARLGFKTHLLLPSQQVETIKGYW